MRVAMSCGAAGGSWSRRQIAVASALLAAPASHFAPAASRAAARISAETAGFASAARGLAQRERGADRDVRDALRGRDAERLPGARAQHLRRCVAARKRDARPAVAEPGERDRAPDETHARAAVRLPPGAHRRGRRRRHVQPALDGLQAQAVGERGATDVRRRTAPRQRGDVAGARAGEARVDDRGLGTTDLQLGGLAAAQEVAHEQCAARRLPAAHERRQAVDRRRRDRVLAADGALDAGRELDLPLVEGRVEVGVDLGEQVAQRRIARPQVGAGGERLVAVGAGRVERPPAP